MAFMENLRRVGSAEIVNSRVVIRVGDVSSWVGCMGNVWARSISWLSLGLLPTAAVFLSIWRIVYPSVSVAVGVALIVLAIGVGCVLLGERIANVRLPDSGK